MTDRQRKIIHVDADCFYAAIEMRDNPSLADKPVAVGGSTNRRGVISTCNYAAREFGVHSAMATATALKLCPGLVLVPSRFHAYREASAAMREIFFEYTSLVEPLSLDEAFLDVSECTQCQGSATLIAEEIRQRIFERLNITVSAGVASNKFLAKVASDWNKPNGTFVVPPDDVEAFVLQLPVKRIFGVGKVTAKKLERFGVVTCGDLRQFTVFELVEKFGGFGKRLFDLCRGDDNRAVKPSHRRKSLSVENTFSADLKTNLACQEKLPALIAELNIRLAKVGEDYLVTKLFVKLKFDDFSQTTVECLATKVDESILQDLCEQGYKRKTKPVRLLGVGVRFMDLREHENTEQINLFDE
jgi:DNA polymerase-4